jgi:protein-S-isoprenylcysteine O-methyltransferase Ste14
LWQTALVRRWGTRYAWEANICVIHWYTSFPTTTVVDGSINGSTSMEFLSPFTITMFVIWCISEIVITVISAINRITAPSADADKFSFMIVWLSTIPAIIIAYLLQSNFLFFNGFGNLSILFPFLSILGCLFIGFGVTIRLLAVATLKQQFTTKVSIREQHKLMEQGIYKNIRHPAYLGHLMSLCGIGLISGNWISLFALVVFPLLGILYRIHVEEKALLRSFGSSYQEYADRTKRLLPRIW